MIEINNKKKTKILRIGQNNSQEYSWVKQTENKNSLVSDHAEE